MCAMHQLALFDGWTSSAAGSPVRTSPLQDVRGAFATVRGRGSGASTLASSESFDLRSLSSRTSAPSGAEGSTSCSVTLPRAGTMRRGIASPLPPSAPLTAVTGSSWSRGEYPTPTATPYGSGQNGTKQGRPFNNAGTPSLHTWAKARPTPSATDWKGSSRVGQRRGQLSEAILLWPSPTRSDARGSRRHGYRGSAHPGTTLLDAASGRLDLPMPKDGERTPWPVALNPLFVEALMGFPAGWTGVDLPPSGMPSSRRSRKRSGGL